MIDVASMTDVALHVAAPPLVAWIPFVSPIPPPGAMWWLLIVPLIAAISMVWKAVRLPSLERYWAAVIVMTAQVLVGMAVLGAALLLLVRGVIPLLPVG